MINNFIANDFMWRERNFKRQVVEGNILNKCNMGSCKKKNKESFRFHGQLPSNSCIYKGRCNRVVSKRCR